MLSLLGLSFTCRDEEEELTLEQQDALDAFREKFFLWLSFGSSGVILLFASVSYVAQLVGLIV